MSELIIPGMMDPHVHLRGLNWSHKGTFFSETAAALAGGYTLVLDMPNTPPATITPEHLAIKIAAFRAEAVCDWGVYYGASPQSHVSDYAAIIEPVCGLKIYNNATTGMLLVEDQSLRERIYAAWPAQRVIAVHAEEETVAQILALVRQYRKWTHFCHISSAYEMALLTAAKAEGLPISIGVTPHHLFLTEDDLPTLGPLGLMKPELKTRADQAALWHGIDNRVVDVVESDHAPHTLEEKYSGQPVYGVPGLETTLPLLCMAAHEGRLTHDRIIELVATQPRHIFGIPDDETTYTLVDLDDSWVIERAGLYTACGWSPFEGMRVRGRVQEVYLRGTRVFSAGAGVIAAPGFGRNCFPVPVRV